MMTSKKRDCYNTPSYIFDQLNDVFSFTLDAACDSTNVKCVNGFRHDLGEDGLSSSWSGHRVFCNPPFSNKLEWINKAIKEVEGNNCPIVVMVLPLNCLSAEMVHKNIIAKGYFYEILCKRIQFLDNDTKRPVHGNDTGTAIVYFKKRIST